LTIKLLIYFFCKTTVFEMLFLRWQVRHWTGMQYALAQIYDPGEIRMYLFDLVCTHTGNLYLCGMHSAVCELHQSLHCPSLSQFIICARVIIIGSCLAAGRCWLCDWDQAMTHAAIFVLSAIITGSLMLCCTWRWLDVQMLPCTLIILYNISSYELVFSY